jgi:glycosyltransferase involved in cell wall biosynthesis
LGANHWYCDSEFIDIHQSNMSIEAYILVWNEMDILPLVIKHYQKFCDQITILDNYSTDGSAEYALSQGCKVQKFGERNSFNDQHNMDIKNSCWKGSQADWVIVCDCDEVLYHPFFMLKAWDKVPFDYNAKNQVTIFKTIGWQIMSNDMPKDDLLEITNGYEFSNYAKFIIFNPKAIQEINYNPGAHRINPIGDVRYSEESLYVLHYKHIGGVERTIQRYAEYQPRMSRLNRQRGYGVHYWRTVGSLHEEWNERMAKSKPLI